MRWLIYEQTHISPIVGVLRFRLLVGRLTASDPDAVRDALSLLEGHLSDREYFAAVRTLVLGRVRGGRVSSRYAVRAVQGGEDGLADGHRGVFAVGR